VATADLVVVVTSLQLAEQLLEAIPTQADQVLTLTLNTLAVVVAVQLAQVRTRQLLSVVMAEQATH
jgi:hypothetical protein